MSINRTVVKEFVFEVIINGQIQADATVRTTTLRKARSLMKEKFKGTKGTFKVKR